MHGKSFLERFRSKNAPPQPAKRTARQQPAPRPRAKRLMGAPLEFWADVCRLTKGRATLVVAMYIYRRVQICGSQTVTLPSGELAELGIARQYKQMALTNLERVRLIKVENARGRTARVTLTWQLH
jgi:hypothetical protein